MMRTVQVCLGKRIRRFLRGFLMFVLVMPRMRGLGLDGLMSAILSHRRKGGLQWKQAKQKDEQQTFHLATESNINTSHRQKLWRT